MKLIASRFRFIFVALCLLVTINACSMFGPSFKGTLVQPSATAPEINLTDANGNPFQLSALHGNVVLVFFGFTNCVAECPLTMAKLKQAFENLGEKSQAVKVAMVSTDPVRDTPQALLDFLGKFNPTFIGLPGNADQLTPIWKDYGVIVLDGGETHSSNIYVIDKSGNFRLTLNTDLTSEDITNDVNILLAEK